MPAVVARLGFQTHLSGGGGLVSLEMPRHCALVPKCSTVARHWRVLKSTGEVGNMIVILIL